MRGCQPSGLAVRNQKSEENYFSHYLLIADS